ncbi:MAG TPA: ectonucleotide pyrophosphatase/phosphodiesterase [Acidobacteriaceae bacterium]|nr:ectonucleotide pyrophosphatase/phosphodiesterase [Acidobacteriaceae bacterium]
MPRLLRRLALLAALAVALAPFAPAARAQQARSSSSGVTPVIHVANGPNAPAQRSKHYVVLVSLDGFRYDYPRLYGAPHLLAIGRRGASAPNGMVPSYPSLTFPNHYAIITGLYPEHSGIVANTFYDPARKQIYSYRNAATVTDGSWYKGTPLWSLAEQQGMRTACFFWPGSEAKIAGERPTYYLHYTNNYPDQQRIDQVIAWLKLPAAQRPHFITLYYPNVDHQGHLHGPDSPQVRDAVHHVDKLMGILEHRLNALHLPIDLIILSDHGMARVQGDWINLDKYADLDDFTTVGPLLYPKSEAEADHAYQQLKAADADFKVYRRAHVPAELHYSSNPREGDPIILAEGPHLIRAHAPSPGQKEFTPVGEHGYNPFQMNSMRAIFFAEGPDIRPGTTLKPFENVNVYPFIAKILGLRAPKVDGNPWILSKALRGEAAQ